LFISVVSETHITWADNSEMRSTLKIRRATLAVAVCCLLLAALLFLFQGRYAAIQGLLAFAGVFVLILDIAEVLKKLFRKSPTARQPAPPELIVRKWDEGDKTVVEIRASGLETLPYVDGMSKQLIQQSSRATKAVAEAVQLMQKERYDEADAKATEAIKTIESSDLKKQALELSQFYLIRGDVAFNAGHFSEAEGFYGLSYELAVDVKDDFLIMASSHGTAATKASQGKHVEALELFERVIAIHAENPVAWYNKSVILTQLGRYQEALKASEEAIKLDPRHVNSRCSKGVALGELGRFEEALAALNEAIELDQNNALLWYNQGVVLQRGGRCIEALRAFDHAIRLNPKYVSAWDNKGVTFDRLGRNEEALAALNEAIRLDPRHALAWYNRGVSLQRLGRHEEALASYDESLRLDPKNAPAWSNKGNILTRIGRAEDGLMAYDEALRIDPKFTNAWCGKALALFLLNRHDEALQAIDKAVELDPMNDRTRDLKLMIEVGIAAEGSI